MIGFAPRTIGGAPPTIGFPPLFVKNEPFSPKSPVPAARHRHFAPFGAEPAVWQPEPVWTNTAVKYATFLDACEIQVDRGDGKGFNLLTMDTTPGYTDTQPFPATKIVWTYRSIYQVADARVGVWSQNVSIAVQA